MKEKNDMIKFVGIAATLIGMAATLVTSWVDDKKMEERIEEKVNDAIANHFNGEES